LTTRGRRPIEEEEDPWELESGLANDIDITVKKSRFGYLDNYQNGEAALLIWDYESPDLDSDPQYPIIWPLGAGWDVANRGASVEHEKRTRFVDSSMIGRLIKRCTDIGAMDTLRERGTPRNASIWEGMKFHIIREAISFGEASSIPDTEHFMPTEFLGVEGTKTSARSSRAASTRTSAAPRGRAARVEEPDDKAPESDLEAKLTDLAKKLDLEKFQKAALNIDGINDNENADLLVAVLEDGNDGFWAKAQEDE